MRSIARCLIFVVVLPLVTAAPQSAAAQNAPDLVKLLPGEAAGWRPAGPDRVFNRETSVRYLRGAGETYLAYGFRRLLVREYSDTAGAPLVAEVYDMGTAGDAFGVFSNDPSGEAVAAGNEALYGRGILRFWKGAYFVRLRAAKETSGTRGLLTDLGRKIAAAIPEEGARPTILGCLPGARLIKGSVRYLHKQSSLNGHYYLVDENALLLDEGTEAALGRYHEAGGEALLLVCRYRTAADARRAYLKFGRVYFSGKFDDRGDSMIERIESGEFGAAQLSGACLILVLESPGRASCEALLGAAASSAQQIFPQKTPGRR
jgi:hypothetical protein